MFIHIMHDVHLAGVDLNLLVALSALVAEENVTRAGQRVGLSQSAMSHALSRLRALLEDPILVRAQGKMVATHRAKALAERVDEGLATLDHALHGSPRFDPRTTTRTFTVGMNDYVELVLLPPLLARLREEAPGVDLWVVSTDEDFGRRLASDALDLVFAPIRDQDRTPGIMDEVLFEDRFVCAMRARHPLAASRMTLARFADASHVLIAPRGQKGSFTDDTLASLGRPRRVAVGIPNFLIVPHLLESSDLLVVLAERVAAVVARHHALALADLPIEIPPFSISQIWHARSSTDDGHAWLRRLFREVASATGLPAPAKRRRRAR